MHYIWNVFTTIRISDLLDIACLSYIIFKGFQLIRETKAMQLFKGILIIAGVYLVSTWFKLQTMRLIFKTCFSWGLLALIILFQPELRRILEKVGRTSVSSFSMFSGSSDTDLVSLWTNAVDAICSTAQELSASKTGALIVCERQTKLGEQIATGVILDCKPSTSIFGTIFFPNTPLHDGAVIIRDGMIHAAGCFLPKPQNEELINKQLGSRHRAAIGMSENADCIVIVVSEENGNISVAEDGTLTRGYTKNSLKELLSARLIPVDTSKDTAEKSLPQRLSERLGLKWKRKK